MATEIPHRFTGTSGEALEPFRFVRKDTSTSKFVYADAGEVPDAITMDRVEAADKNIALVAINSPGGWPIHCAAAIALGVDVYVADDGKGSGTVVGAPVGRLMTAAGAADDVVPIMLRPGLTETEPVLVKTADYTLLASDSGKVFTNTGAAGAVTLSAPAAKKGMKFTLMVNAAQAFRFDANGTETVALPSTGAQGAAGKYMEADAVGEWAEWICIEDGKWAILGYAGTWTAQA